MDRTIWLSIGSIFATGVFAITAVWLAARFASQQAHLGRVWERKAEAYSAILEALHEMEEWYSQNLDDEFLAREPDAVTKITRDSDYRQARQLLRRSIARQVWLLPIEVQQRVGSMNKAIATRRESWFEAIDEGCSEVKKTLADVANFARTDLETKKKSRSVDVG